jgi:Asp-tRNA(Asn)/Glu-tRNA(Gln) amidotransferase A subunit family amidase
MASSVEKAAEILKIIAGKDIHDPATLNIPENFNFDFTSDLNKESLKGKRFGLLPTGSNDKDGEKALQKIRELLENAGAIVMDIEDKREYPGEAELLVLMYEFKENLEKYLATSNSPYKTLSELINFNDANKEQVLKHFDQSIFIDSDKTSSLKNEYLIALEQIIDTRNGIDQLLEENNINALVGLSWSPAWAINHDGGDDEAIAAYRFWVNGSYAAMAGYPHITVPLDYIDGLPIGVSFIGTAWSDKQLIEYAHSFEELNNFNPKPKL